MSHDVGLGLYSPQSYLKDVSDNAIRTSYQRTRWALYRVKFEAKAAAAVLSATRIQTGRRAHATYERLKVELVSANLLQRLYSD